MAQDVGKSHGFGRVSPVTRPSPYSPVQFRGRGPHAPDAPPEPALRGAKRRRGFLRRAAAGIVLVAVAAGGVAYFALNRTPGQPPARTVVDAAMLASAGSPTDY